MTAVGATNVGSVKAYFDEVGNDCHLKHYFRWPPEMHFANGNHHPLSSNLLVATFSPTSFFLANEFQLADAFNLHAGRINPLHLLAFYSSLFSTETLSLLSKFAAF